MLGWVNRQRRLRLVDGRINQLCLQEGLAAFDTRAALAAVDQTTFVT